VPSIATSISGSGRSVGGGGALAGMSKTRVRFAPIRSSASASARLTVHDSSTRRTRRSSNTRTYFASRRMKRPSSCAYISYSALAAL
jgi:hypothetical protein